MSEQTSVKPEAPMQNGNGSARKKWLLGLLAVFALAGVAYGIYWYLTSRDSEYSDDAYVAADIVQITPQVAGTVVAIAVNETDHVRAGETLVTLDNTNTQVALQEAEAQLAQTVREVRTLYTSNNGLTATIAQHRAELERARADLATAQADFTRRQHLAGTGAVSQEEIQHAQSAVEAARSNVAALTATLTIAQQQLVGNQALTGGTTVRNQPKVQAAAVKVIQTYLDTQRSAVRAPIDGYVGKRSVQLGQRVPIGAQLLTIIPLNQIWVDANYKEAQLRRIRIGQPVILTADIYGSKVDFHGRVEGIGSGTGAAFSLLPAQNATGNWIKVVQRVPVRISLDANEIASHPLRVGMSMETTVDVSQQGGAVLANSASASSMQQTSVYSGGAHAADALVDKIITRNLGEKLSAQTTL